jgi:2,5-dioxopentanoate dehydrogenase
MLTGAHYIGGRAVAGGGATFTAVDPIAGTPLTPEYRAATTEQVAAAAAAAGEASAAFAATTRAQRASLLRAIADGLMALGEDLVARVVAETALPPARVQGERARTIAQLQQFANLLDEGSWVEARIDRADRARQPQPKPDVRSMLVPLGPVAVFGASNFPLAYSVVGGDTASALAAGCPVVVKGQPAHPGTSEMVAAMVVAVVQRLGLPAGCFGLVHGHQPATGQALVQHPAIAAVGFTGSVAAGRSLCDTAAARTSPIPVFAEMGSMNPVVVLPRALAARGAAIGEAIAASALMAQGQFCTSPGLVAWVDGPGSDALSAALQQRLGASTAGPAVHPSIRSNYERALQEVAATTSTLACGAAAPAVASALCPALLSARADMVLRTERLRHEIYGPAVLAVPCRDAAELRTLCASFDGHLTATVHGEGDDFAAHAAVLAALRQKVGRLIANGVPTGVEVCGAMVHGGPYPAASDARFTAVGTTAIRRWVRPACWQDWPHDLLPPELRDDNPLRIRRWVDGVLAVTSS